MNIKEQMLNFNKNLKFLMQRDSINQKQLSSKTGISAATINNYVSKNSEPSLKFLLWIKKIFNVDIDAMFESDLEKIAESKTISINPANARMEKYLDSYILYFYNSSEYKGKVSSYSKTTLKYGVLSLVLDNSTGKVSAIASFIKTRDEAEEAKLKLEGLTHIQDIHNVHDSIGVKYLGNIDISDTQLFIYLKNDEQNDQSLIILNNPPSNKKYIGGLGTVNSISRGREHMPCVQFIIVSKNILKIPDGEIYNLLSLGVSDVNVEKETEQLISLFKNLYVNVDLKDDLSDFQKKKILENSLTNIFSELVDANLFRFAKVSNMEDDDYYRIIKGEEI